MYACPICGSYETPERVVSFWVYPKWPRKFKPSPRYFATLQSCPKCKVVTSKSHPDEEEKMLASHPGYSLFASGIKEMKK